MRAPSFHSETRGIHSGEVELIFEWEPQKSKIIWPPIEGPIAEKIFVTMILVSLGFLAGGYGIDFVNMPELQNKSGYVILLNVMAMIAVKLLTIFRRKRWL